MRTENLTTMVATAVATAVVTLVLAWPASVNATGPALGENGPATVKGAPKLVLDSVEIEATTAAAEAKPGTRPAFTLVAVNRSAKATTAKVKMLMTRLTPASVLSRIGPMPTVAWTRTIEVSLGPNERKSIPLAPGIAIEAGDSFSLRAMPDVPRPERPKVQNPSALDAHLIYDQRGRDLVGVTGAIPAENG